MKLYEFCRSFNLELELQTSFNGYSLAIKEFDGIILSELEHLVNLDTQSPHCSQKIFEGGTCWTSFHGKSLEEVKNKLCQFISNRIVVLFDGRMFRCPELE